MSSSPSSHSLRLADARQLWELCFHDDGVFVDFYFTHCASPQETILHYTPSRYPIGHIGTPRYTLGIGDRQLESLYISGACVHPDYRRGGLMRGMMTELMQAASSSVDAVILIPADEALRSYYQRTFGFATIGQRATTTSLERAIALGHICAPQPSSEAFLRASRTSAQGIRHSLAQCHNILREYSLYPTTLIRTATDGTGSVVGLCLARLVDESLQVDYLDGAPWARQQMLEELLKQTSPSDVSIRLDQSEIDLAHDKVYPWGMLRPLRLMPWLELWAHRHVHECMAFTYQDPLLPHLSGTYHCTAGHVHHTPSLDGAAPRLDLTEVVDRFIPALDIRLVHE